MWDKVPLKLKIHNYYIVFEKRYETGILYKVLVTIIAVIASFIIAGLIFLMLGFSPLEIYKMIINTFTSVGLMHETLLRSTPIILAALGLSIAFKMNFWNIGAEGQLYMGAFAATGVVLLHVYYGMISPDLLLLVMLLASFIAGSAWCLFPAFLKTRLGANEIITTLMMNYIAILFVNYLIFGPWRDPQGYGFPFSVNFPPYARPSLPFMSVGTLMLTWSLVTASLVFSMLKYTIPGFEIRVVGQNLEAAKYAGMNISSTIMLGSLLSGGLSGIAGMVTVTTLIGRLTPDVSPGYGYMAIIVAYLAGLNPLLIIPAGILFGGLLTAGDAMQYALSMPKTGAQILQALIFLFTLLGEFVKRYGVTVVRSGGKDGRS